MIAVWQPGPWRAKLGRMHIFEKIFPSKNETGQLNLSYLLWLVVVGVLALIFIVVLLNILDSHGLV